MAREAVHVHVDDGTALVVAAGAVDLAKSSMVRSVLRDLIRAGHPRVVVDLADVSVIDAAIGGVLAAQRERADQVGVDLCVTGATGIVREVLEVLGLEKQLRSTVVVTRPDLPCCVALAPAPQVVAISAPVRRSALVPNDKIGAVLVAMINLPADDPDREHLHAQAVRLALPAAHALAAAYRGRGESDDDLRQVAALGAIKAVDGFDPRRGHPFSDYAIPTILGELRRHFRDRGWGMRVPRRVKENLLQTRKVNDQLTQELGRQPLPGDLADALDIPVKDVREALGAAQAYRPDSLSLPLGAGGAQLSDMLGESDGAFTHVDEWLSVADVLRALPDRTRRVLALRFCGDLSQSEIAAQVGLSQVHVSRILSQAMVTLRKALFAAE